MAKQTDIDRATEFFKAFFEAEFKALYAKLSGAKTLAALDRKKRAMMTEQCAPLAARKLEGASKEAYANTLKTLAPRTIFLVEEHKIGRRKLYRAVTSTHQVRKIMGYSEVYWADNSNKIIATYFGCASCDTSGFYEKAVCPDCHGKGWFRHTGERIKAYKPVALVKLVRPTRDSSAALYDALID